MRTALLLLLLVMQGLAQEIHYPLTGTSGFNAQWGSNLNTVVVFIKFQGDADFTGTRSKYENDFNSTSQNSLKLYYNEVSYNKIDITSYLFPAAVGTSNTAYVFPKTRGYFMEYSGSNTIGYRSVREARLREHEILDSAITAIKESIPSGLTFDFNSDGMADNVMFIFQGNSGPWGDVGLWPHSGVLDSYDVRINGSRVYHYSIHLETQAQVSTYCHETFHVFGAPDLYRYFVNGTPVGSWDIMASGNCHMGAYMKHKYTGKKWITDIPVITKSGRYMLNPLVSDSNNCYRINSPYTNDEFFIVEYRNKSGLYEAGIPGSGLLVYRINAKAGEGNGGGPPDEIYVFRKGGTPTAGGTISQAHFSSTVGRTAINDYTSDPKSFLNNGGKAGLDIRNVGAAGATISFDVVIVDCSITQPAANSVYKTGAIIPIGCIAKDSAAIAKVDFFINNTKVFTDSSAGYNYDWNTTGYGSGKYILKTRATSSTGVYKEDSLSVILSAGNPVAVLNSLTDSMKVGDGDTLLFQAAAYGMSGGISSVQLYIDEILKATIANPPYQFRYVVNGLSGGYHKLKVVATDSLQNKGSAEIQFNVIRYLIKEGFETTWPPAGWNVNSLTYGWYQSLKGPFSGSACAATRNYHAAGEATLETPAFVPDSASTLEFYWMDNSLDITSPILLHDTTYCEISVEGGPYSVLAFLSANDVEPAYHKQVINLSGYRAKSVKIRWRDVSDESLEAMGTALDDIVITALPLVNGTGNSTGFYGNKSHVLLSGYPNPFNPSTTIQYTVKGTARTSIRIYDVLGNKIATLIDEVKNEGQYQLQWHASQAPSGIYFCELQSGQNRQVVKLLLLK